MRRLMHKLRPHGGSQPMWNELLGKNLEQGEGHEHKQNGAGKFLPRRTTSLGPFI